ncbi:HNH endonuclease [Synechococcus phage S-CRM01]|uniref:HNH endonuclease n=1 Tax=Synechococcus phage S-CRM01 TaxID=1026955 RepID=UPI000209E41E|nr:HNH endonuclease [Synechococcus phage S-CRM01]AEC53151.1 HNH endonuclease [Synechococcus phage S-CRM01]
MDHIEPHSTVLVLNSDYNPINITTWKRAVLLLVKQKAHIISSKVIRLVHYIKLPYSRLMANHPTRALIYKRDDYTCGYCGAKEGLTLDHIIPQSKGGQDTWENLVTCCLKCNLKKGDKMLSETNMKLNVVPRAPYNKMTLTLKKSGVKQWIDYCYG